MSTVPALHKLLHIMLRVRDLEQSIQFYTDYLGMSVLRRKDYKDGRFTLAFLGYGPESQTAVLELTHNWDEDHYDMGNAYGHIALAVTDIYTSCRILEKQGVKIIRQPGPMAFDPTDVIAFIEDPDGYKIELIEKDIIFDKRSKYTSTMG